MLRSRIVAILTLCLMGMPGCASRSKRHRVEVTNHLRAPIVLFVAGDRASGRIKPGRTLTTLDHEYRGGVLRIEARDAGGKRVLRRMSFSGEDLADTEDGEIIRVEFR